MSNITITPNLFGEVDPAGRTLLADRTYESRPTVSGAPATTGGNPGGNQSKGTLTTQRVLRFGILIVSLLLLSLGLTYRTSSSLEDQIDKVHSAGLATQSIEQSITDGQTIAVAFFGRAVASAAGATEVADDYQQQGIEAFTSFDEHLAEVAKYIGSGKGADTLTSLQELYTAFKEGALLALQAPVTEISFSDETFKAATDQFNAIRGYQEELSDLLEESGFDKTDEAKSDSHEGVLLAIFASLLGLVAFVFIGRRVYKSVGVMQELQSETERATAEVMAARDRERLESSELQSKVDSMLGSLAGAAAGDLTVSVAVSGDDAVGQMGQALSKLLKDLRGSVSSIASNSEALAAASEELQVVAEQMGANSSETSNQVNLVSGASVEVSSNIETASSGAGEMTASIKEIAKNASEAAKVAAQAVEAARLTNSTVSQLGESSAEIGEIVKVITGIAQQTNLLALNATIEAARAGEAGKGFAVVANEVKELAKETAKATEDISEKIVAIQTDTQRSVESISGILDIINQIAEFQDTIASAVEEQAATTSEIARSVTDASRGSAEITANIQAVATAADSTAAGASDSQRAATELARMAADLQALVGRFSY